MYFSDSEVTKNGGLLSYLLSKPAYIDELTHRRIRLPGTEGEHRFSAPFAAQLRMISFILTSSVYALLDIKVDVVDDHLGPTVTRFELAQGSIRGRESPSPFFSYLETAKLSLNYGGCYE